MTNDDVTQKRPVAYSHNPSECATVWVNVLGTLLIPGFSKLQPFYPECIGLGYRLLEIS
jgi:hypothetical protein